MELHHLRYVVKLAKCLHYSKAAIELSITQPSLSQRIIQIEEELGVKLFERKTRSVSLTAAGEEFVMYAEKVLASYEQLQEAMRIQSKTKKGSLRIGTLLNMARLDVNAHVLSFQKEHPQIQVTINEIVGSFELIRQLEAGEFDVVFCIPSPEMKLPERIKVHPILTGRVVAVMSKNHRLNDKSHIMIKELAGENLLFPAKAHSLFGLALAACRNNGFEPKIVAHVSQIDTGIEMASKGIGITLVSSQFFDSSDRKDITAIPIEPVIPRDISLAYSSQNANISAVRIFRDFILRTANVAAPHPSFRQ